MTRSARLLIGLALLASVVGLAPCRFPGSESAAAPASGKSPGAKTAAGKSDREGGAPAAFVPSKTAPAFAKAPTTWALPLQIVGGTGFVRGGIPFPPGFLGANDALRLDDGSPFVAEPIAHWPDGSVKWLLVEALPSSDRPSLLPGGGDGAAVAFPELSSPKPAAGELALVVDGDKIDLGAATWTDDRRTKLSHRLRAVGRTARGLEWSARLERAAGESADRLRLQLRNPQPMSETDGQPTCMTLGCPNTAPIQTIVVSSPRGCRVRWAAEEGAKPVEGGVSLLPSAMELRPGERYGWEILIGSGPEETRLLEYSAAWACSSRALGPLVPMSMDRFGDYELNAIAGAQGIHDGRARPHWRNPRDFGEDQRDWDGGNVDTDFQTHNNEYEVHLAYAKQRLRTMGLHGVSRTWHELGLTGTRHFANVDIYHIHEGPLPFMHGAAFQHIRHGGAGQGDQHRSSFAPNMAHQTGRGLLAWYGLTGDPLLLEAFLEVAENTRWRVMNGPGMPGISSTQGEERAPANALGILTDAWAFTGDSKWLEAAKKVVEESHARTKSYVTSASGDWTCKPWMLSLLVVTLDEFQDQVALFGRPQDGVSAKESAGLYKTFLSRHVKSGPDLIHLPYQVAGSTGKDIDESRDAWSIVSADALVDYFPDMGFALFRAGSRSIWHTKHPVGKYAKLLNHTIAAGWGHRTMTAMVQQSKEAPATAEASP